MSSRPYILISGTGFKNQGAYLMLLAAAEQIRTRFDGVPVVSYSTGSEVNKRMAGVYSLWPARLRRGVSALASRSGVRRKVDGLPFIRDGDVSAVFDGSGFAFGDQWASADLGARASEFERWAAMGTPIYMLPQAFGPFKKVANPTRRALAVSALAFARDPESFGHVRSLGAVNDSELALSPDFTGLVHPSEYMIRRHGLPDGVALIVPNANIWERAGSDEDRRAYIGNLTSFVRAAQDHGMTVRGVSHGGTADKQILDFVNAELEGPKIAVVSGSNGLELKAMIGTAALVISGRFHATVSAFHQGVPTLVHGWSHKYVHLCAEWGCPELQLDPYGDQDLTRQRVIETVDNRSIPERLALAASRINSETEAMWETVANNLRSRGVVS